MKANPAWGLAIFAAGWSLITLVLDRGIGYSVYLQIRAESYPSVSGVMTHSEVISGSSGDDTTYDVAVKYEYKVGATEYASDWYRYGSFITSDETPAKEFVKQHPPGAKVTVYYDPDEPGDAVLQTGIQGMSFFFVMFMTPFNIVMVGLWVVVIQKWLRPSPAGGVPILQQPRYPPLAAAAGTAILIPFVSIFVVGIGMRGELPAGGLLVVWGIMIAAAVGVYLWQRSRGAEAL